MRQPTALLVLLLLTACRPETRTPEGTARLLLKTVGQGDYRAIFNLLTPEIQDGLRRLAEIASRQSKGARTFQPEQMIATQLDQSKHRFGRIGAVVVNGDRAQVTLEDVDGQHSEILHLRRIEKRWRVSLSGLIPDPAIRH